MNDKLITLSNLDTFKNELINLMPGTVTTFVVSDSTQYYNAIESLNIGDSAIIRYDVTTGEYGHNYGEVFLCTKLTNYAFRSARERIYIGFTSTPKVGSVGYREDGSTVTVKSIRYEENGRIQSLQLNEYSDLNLSFSEQSFPMVVSYTISNKDLRLYKLDSNEYYKHKYTLNKSDIIIDSTSGFGLDNDESFKPIEEDIELSELQYIQIMSGETIKLKDFICDFDTTNHFGVFIKVKDEYKKSNYITREQHIEIIVTTSATPDYTAGHYYTSVGETSVTNTATDTDEYGINLFNKLKNIEESIPSKTVINERVEIGEVQLNPTTSSKAVATITLPKGKYIITYGGDCLYNASASQQAYGFSISENTTFSTNTGDWIQIATPVYYASSIVGNIFKVVTDESKKFYLIARLKGTISSTATKLYPFYQIAKIGD